MKTCNFYPMFEPNQVLTSEQLNQVTAFFDKHDRLTRSKLIGAGIVCGLHIIYQGSPVKITISEGTGVTSQGYLIYSPEAELTRYREYTDRGKYDKFGDEDSQIQLWELLPKVVEEEDENIKPLKKDFLKNKAVILYLERYIEDLETCMGDDCDEKGKRVNFCVKKLLINISDLEKIIKECKTVKPFKDIDDKINAKFRLPEISIGRESRLISKSKYEDYGDVFNLYMKIIKPALPGIMSSLNLAYKTFSPVVPYDDNPFGKNIIEKKIEEILEANKYSIQYIYDYLKDIILAYDEFKEHAFDLASECNIDEDCFPRHLMLGEAIPVDKCELSVYRQEFIQVPVYNGQNELMKKVRMLFRRLVYQVHAFDIEKETESVKITPSDEKQSELSERSIPYYYQPQWKDQAVKKNVFLHHIWNYDFARKCKPYLNLGYFSDKYKEDQTPQFVRDPLNYDTDKYGFYRVEGHLNKSCDEVLPGLLNDLEEYNLPFKVIKLRLGKDPADEDLNLDCRFTDLETSYGNFRTEYMCFLQKKLKFFAELDFGGQPAEEVQPGALRGFVLTENKEPLPGVNLTLKNAKTQKVTMGTVTNAKGQFYIRNINPGQYVINANITGFEPYSIGVTIKSGQTENVNVILQNARFTGVKPDSTHHVPDYSGVRYAELSREEGAAKKYSPEELEMMLMSAKKGEYLVKTDYFKLSESSIGNYYLNYGESGSVDFINFIENNKDKFTGIEERFDLGKAIDKYYRPVKILEAIESLIASIPEKITDFNQSIVEEREAELVSIAREYRDHIYKNPDNPENPCNCTESEIILHLIAIIEKCLRKVFESLIKTYKERLKEILKLTLFNYFIEDHPGVVHMAGVPAGGTFILLCDEKGQVVGDFALPYICCSDCPPIAFVAAPVQVVFRLPDDNYCYNDDNNYTIIAEPAGGEVSGPGVSKDPDTGEFKFNPKEAGPGMKKLTYNVNLNNYETLVNVIQINPKFTYSLEKPQPGEAKRTVRFTAIPEDAESYEWDFGDGSDNSIEQNPVHTFDLSENSEFEISLTVKKKKCTETYTDNITIPYCTADFTYKVDNVSDNIAVVSFDAEMKEADEYSWDFGNGKTSGEEDPVMQFDLANNREFEVTLKVKKGDCEDEETQVITITPCSAEFNVDRGAVEGNEMTYYFNAETPDAESYKWDFGDGTQAESNPNIQHKYLLKEEEQTITVTLTIEKGNCTSTYSVDITLPKAEVVEFSLEKNRFCKNDETKYEFKLSTAGEVTGPGVDKQNGVFIFIPAMDDVKPGFNKFTFKAESGSTADLVVRVFNPVADFKVANIYQPNPQADPSTYAVAVENTSTGAQNYTWRLGDKIISQEAKPEIIINNTEPGAQYEISLTASIDKCSSTKPDVITIPTRDNPPDGRDDVVNIFTPDNVIITGMAAAISGVDRVTGAFRKNTEVTENLTSHESFDNALTPNVVAYRDTRNYFTKVNEELSNTASLRLYTSGAKNNEIAEQFASLSESTYSRMKSYSGANADQKRQFTYNLMLLQLSQMFNLVMLQKKDIETGSPLEAVMKRTMKYFAVAAELGVDINIGGKLKTIIMTTAKMSRNKPVLIGLLKRFLRIINA